MTPVHHAPLEGLIDLQVNGAGGHDLTSDPESMWAVGTALRRFVPAR